MFMFFMADTQQTRGFKTDRSGKTGVGKVSSLGNSPLDDLRKSVSHLPLTPSLMTDITNCLIPTYSMYMYLLETFYVNIITQSGS